MQSLSVFAVAMVLLLVAPNNAQAEHLKIATYNVGMLNVGKPVPFLAERSKVLGKHIHRYLHQERPHALAIQEMWTNQSEAALKNVHPDYTLVTYRGDAWMGVLEHPSGLGILVRKDLKVINFLFYDFESVESWFCGWGHICDRGLLVAVIEIAGKRVAITNTHLTPGIGYFGHRILQMRETAIITHSLFRNEPKVDHVIVAGDFNYSPNFGEFRDGDDGTVAEWELNAELYFDFYNETTKLGVNCIESCAADPKSCPFTQQRDDNRTTRISESTNIEPDQRIDIIYGCTKVESKSLLRGSYRLLFEEPLVDVIHEGSPLKVQLSDHFGYETILQFPE